MASGRRNSPFVIPVFIPHAGCPHACLFCNQHSVTGVRNIPSEDEVAREIARWLAFPRKPERFVEIAFFGGTFLGLSKALVTRYLDAASRFPGCGIRFSTRPDTLTTQRLGWLSGYPVSTIEIGVQSFSDTVLLAANRGHDVRSAIKAAEKVKAFGAALGIQLMAGLPESSVKRDVASARIAARLAPDLVRIYPTVVLEGSPLARAFLDGRYRPLTESAAISRVAAMVRVLDGAKIPIARMGLQVEEGLGDAVMAGPLRSDFGDAVRSRMLCNLVVAALVKRNLEPEGRVTLFLHPKRISRLRGNRNTNLPRLLRAANTTRLRIRGDDGLSMEAFRIQ